MARTDFGPAPLSLPQPVFIVAAYDGDGAPCAMNAAWGGISDSDEVSLCLSHTHKTVKNLVETGAFTISMADAPHVAACDYVGMGGISDSDEVSLCLSHTHKTVKNLVETGAFTISMADAPHVAACDYVGIASGNQVADKFAVAGFTATPSAHVNAPVINELPICLECEVKSYDPETGRLVGRIANVSVDESVMTDGKVDLAKVQALVFDPFNKDYHVIGHSVGGAWSCGKELM